MPCATLVLTSSFLGKEFSWSLTSLSMQIIQPRFTPPCVGVRYRKNLVSIGYQTNTRPVSPILILNPSLPIKAANVLLCRREQLFYFLKRKNSRPHSDFSLP